jgi:hypothetical protein
VTARYLVVKGFAGMGNRLGALLTGIAYAELTGRALVVDWNDFRYSPDGADVFHRLFSAPRAPWIAAVEAIPSVAPEPWRGSLAEPMEEMTRRVQALSGRAVVERLSIDLRRLDHGEDVAVLFSYTFDYRALRVHEPLFPPAWRGLGADAFARVLLRDHVTPSPRIRERARQFARRRFRPSTIGVHVRHTDNVDRPRASDGAAPLDAFGPLLDTCLRDEPEAAVFVATDNRAVLETFARRFPNVVHRRKWYPETPGEAVHGHTRCPDKLRMAEDALTDLFLLSQCNPLVYSSRSSFGRVARVLAAPETPAIDVEQFLRFRAWHGAQRR